MKNVLEQRPPTLAIALVCVEACVALAAIIHLSLFIAGYIVWFNLSILART